MVSVLYDRVIDSTLSRLAGSTEFSTSGCSVSDNDDSDASVFVFLIPIIVLSILLIGVVLYYVVLPKTSSKSGNGLDESLVDNKA